MTGPICTSALCRVMIDNGLARPRRRFRTLKHWCAEYRAKGIQDAAAGQPPDPFGKFHEGRDMLWHQAVKDSYNAGYRDAKKRMA